MYASAFCRFYGTVVPILGSNWAPFVNLLYRSVDNVEKTYCSCIFAKSSVPGLRLSYILVFYSETTFDLYAMRSLNATTTILIRLGRKQGTCSHQTRQAKPTTRIFLFAHSVSLESSTMESFPFGWKTCQRWHGTKAYDLHWYSNVPVWLIVDLNLVGAHGKGAKACLVSPACSDGKASSDALISQSS